MFHQEIYDAEIDTLQKDKQPCFLLYQRIQKHVDTCLQASTYERLLELLPYFTDSQAYPYFHHSGDTQRIFNMCNFLQLELKYHKTPIVSVAASYADFLNLYLTIVFALRRLELAFSPSSIEEAASFLLSIPLNVYAAHIILNNELFENYERVYWDLYHCMKNIWPISDQILWLSFLLEKEELPYVRQEVNTLKELLP